MLMEIVRFVLVVAAIYGVLYLGSRIEDHLRPKAKQGREVADAIKRLLD